MKQTVYACSKPWGGCSKPWGGCSKPCEVAVNLGEEPGKKENFGQEE